MLIVVVGALSIYVKSNKTSADQQQYVQLQGDVRAPIYYVSRDIRMAGAGLTADAMSSALEGVDNENQGSAVQPDRIKLMGNIEEPFVLTIQSSSSGVHVTLNDHSLEQYPYPDSYYIDKIVLLLPRTGSTCRGAAVRQITHVTHSSGGTNEGFNFSPGQAKGINPPGGLSDVCPDGEFTGGTILFVDVREYWLDTTGTYPGLTAGVNGYIGGGAGGVLYLTKNNTHYALAQNIENLQFQYNGNFDNSADGTLDGFTNWQTTWTLDQIGRIRQVRVWVLGRTPNRMTSVSSTTADVSFMYRRPTIANSAGATADDWHKRFLLETTANVRNMSLSLYNTGVR
jgi:hypothetical protein